MKKLLISLSLVLIGFSTSYADSIIRGDAWTINFSNGREIGCTDNSDNICCTVSAYADDNGKIHVLIKNHDGNNYDIQILSAGSPAQAEAEAAAKLTSPNGLEVK